MYDDKLLSADHVRLIESAFADQLSQDAVRHLLLPELRAVATQSASEAGILSALSPVVENRLLQLIRELDPQQQAVPDPVPHT